MYNVVLDLDLARVGSTSYMKIDDITHTAALHGWDKSVSAGCLAVATAWINLWRTCIGAVRATRKTISNNIRIVSQTALSGSCAHKLCTQHTHKFSFTLLIPIVHHVETNHKF